MTKFPHRLVVMEDGEIKEIGTKTIYNTDGYMTMSEWVKSKEKYELVESLPLTSGIGVRFDGKESTNKLGKGSLGYFHNNANSVCCNPQYVNIFTSVFSSAHGLDIRHENFLRVCSAFAARKLIDSNWINQKDEYLAPDESNPKFHQFELDAVIYSLFHSASQQSSLHNMKYKEKNWDIPNHFFWMGKDEVMKLANENNNEDAYNDARLSEDRFVHKFIEKHRLEFSPEALVVLDSASNLVRKSFKLRAQFSQVHEEYQVNNWDCGYYQLKPIWKAFLKKDFDMFRDLYKALADKLRPMVYELGFLRK